MTFVPASVTLDGSFRVNRTPDSAFPLFSPRGEEAWVPDWKPELLYPADAEWQEGQVFRTRHGTDESIWFVGYLDREGHRVVYHRVDAGLTAVTVSVCCDGAASDATKVTVRYTVVGITEAGNDFVRKQKQEDFAARMLQWEWWIAAMDSFA